MVVIDIWEVIRFVVVGIVATVGNISAVWVARHAVTFEVALIAGVIAGMTLSFFLSKFFAFRSLSWNRTRNEAARFLIVYGCSVAIYWIVAVIFGRLLTKFVSIGLAELSGVLLGACVMTVTSYLGHRFFTYRTYRALESSEDET